MKPSALFPTRTVHIFKGNDNATIKMRYAEVDNIYAPENAWDTVDYNRFTRSYPGEVLRGIRESATSPSEISQVYYPQLPRLEYQNANGTAKGNRFYRLGWGT